MKEIETHSTPLRKSQKAKVFNTQPRNLGYFSQNKGKNPPPPKGNFNKMKSSTQGKPKGYKPGYEK